MSNSWRVALLVVTGVVYIGCQAPESETTPATEPATASVAPEMGPDAVAVDAAHYSVVEENDRVRVLRIRYAPGETSVMHYHPDAVAVFLTDHHVKFGLPDGSTVDTPGKARDAVFTPAGQHLPTNTGEGPLELIFVELKGAPGAGGGAAEMGPDPTVADPNHYSVVFENDKVRAIRIKYAPGESSVMHYHPDAVAVFFDDAKGTFELPDGSSEEITAQAGQAMFTPARQHRPTNDGEAFELIQIELK